jgi:hypothetical protein
MEVLIDEISAFRRLWRRTGMRELISGYRNRPPGALAKGTVRLQSFERPLLRK